MHDTRAVSDRAAGSGVALRAAADSTARMASDATPESRSTSAARWISSPSNVKTFAEVAPHSFSAAARDRVEHRLHVGLRLADHAQDVAGRRLLLQRFGQVAVACLELVEQAHVLDRDHRLVGERLAASAIWLVGKRSGLGPSDGDAADRLAVAHSGTASTLRKPRYCRCRCDRVVGVVERRPGSCTTASGRDRARHAGVASGGSRVEARAAVSTYSVFALTLRGEMDQRRRRKSKTLAKLRTAQLVTALRDRVEHRLHVGLRLADHAQDVAGRGLLLERLGEVAVARLQLLEQAHVLDRDDGLVGEGLQQRDLRVGETARLRAARR